MKSVLSLGLAGLAVLAWSSTAHAQNLHLYSIEHGQLHSAHHAGHHASSVRYHVYATGTDRERIPCRDYQLGNLRGAQVGTCDPNTNTLELTVPPGVSLEETTVYCQHPTLAAMGGIQSPTQELQCQNDGNLQFSLTGTDGQGQALDYSNTSRYRLALDNASATVEIVPRGYQVLGLPEGAAVHFQVYDMVECRVVSQGTFTNACKAPPPPTTSGADTNTSGTSMPQGPAQRAAALREDIRESTSRIPVRLLAEPLVGIGAGALGALAGAGIMIYALGNGGSNGCSGSTGGAVCLGLIGGGAVVGYGLFSSLGIAFGHTLWKGHGMMGVLVGSAIGFTGGVVLAFTAAYQDARWLALSFGLPLIGGILGGEIDNAITLGAMSRMASDFERRPSAYRVLPMPFAAPVLEGNRFVGGVAGLGATF